MKENFMLVTEALSVGYKGKKEREILRDVNIALATGNLTCLLGPNGSGKSTLIRTLVGIQPAIKGTILIDGSDLNAVSLQSRSKLISVVLTDKIEGANFLVYELVALGRHPYSSWTGKLSDEDHQIIEFAIKAAGIEEHVTRNINELSDGERQKVMIARALAQECPILFLDEPTAFIDLPGKVEIMRLLKKLTKEHDKTILLSTHDLDLALQISDQLLLVTGNTVKSGVPEDLILNRTFGEAFNKNDIHFNINTGKFDLNSTTQIPIYIEGEETAVKWTYKALSREGFEVSASKYDAKLFINVSKTDDGYLWVTDDKGFHSVGQLIIFLKSREY